MLQHASNARRRSLYQRSRWGATAAPCSSGCHRIRSSSSDERCSRQQLLVITKVPKGQHIMAPLQRGNCVTHAAVQETNTTKTECL